MQPQIAVSTWSLHRVLGIVHQNGPGDRPGGPPQPTWGAGALGLLDLPAALARHGYRRAEICHFHLAGLEREYLQEVRDAFADSQVTIQTLLIDDGDLTDPATRDRDIAWIAHWIGAAAELGVQNARVIAGKSKADAEALAMAISGLRELGQLGRKLGVRVVSENWFDLLGSPKDVHQVLDALGGDAGFLADTGNWPGATKYADLESIFRRAELCHAKCSFAAGYAMDRDDFGRCLDAAMRAGYTGPFTLIYDGPDDDEWAGLALEREFVLARLAGHAKLTSGA